MIRLTATLVSLTLCSAISAQPNDAAVIHFNQSYHMTIPWVEATFGNGIFKDAEFVKHPSVSHWYLTNVKQPGELPDFAVDSLELVLTTQHPVQAFLKVEGEVASCVGFGGGRATHVGNEIKVSLFSARADELFPPPPPDDRVDLPPMCLDVQEPFSGVIPLNIYGLDAGTYSYSVNGAVEGTFTLTRDNVIE